MTRYTVADMERVVRQIEDRRRHEAVRIMEERRKASRRESWRYEG